MRGRAFRAAASIVLAVAASSTIAGPDAAPALVPRPPIDKLVAAAQALAAKGRRDDVDEVVEVLRALRAPAKDVETLRQATTKTLAKAKPSAGPLPEVAAGITAAAAELSAALPAVPDAERPSVAGLVLRLDATQTAAHEALGHVQRDGAWIPAELAAAANGRRRVEDAVRRAKSLEFKIGEGQSAFPPALRVGECVGAGCGGYSIHSNAFSSRQLARQLRGALQALALYAWVQGGAFEPPSVTGKVYDFTMVIVRTKEDYAKALSAAVAAKEIPADVLPKVRDAYAFYGAGYVVVRVNTETEIAPYLVVTSWRALGIGVDPAVQPPLMAGMCEWLCWNVLGRATSGWSGDAPKEEDRSTSDSAAAAAARNEARRRAAAGLVGTRRWLQFLAQRRQDPPWSRSMVADLAKIGGVDLLKCLFCVDYLVQTGAYERVLAETRWEERKPAGFEKALGGLDAFETRWREWLLAGTAGQGLAQRLAAAAAGPSGLARLDKVRAAAVRGAPSVPFDDDLSSACRTHVRYLLAHPERQSAWPDCHEEDLDTPDYSAEGLRAGQASVIVSGVKSADAALDCWMGTFYHRLPLLHPGLAGIGWAMENGVAVLDATTLAVPPDAAAWAAWPAPGAKDVPRGFAATEMPSPVEGEDQTAWGYPVTLQTWNIEHVDGIRLRLVAGGADVACHFSSPREPTNPKLAPTDAFCLIPKQKLAAGTTYSVVVEGAPADAKDLRGWTFTTGK